MLECDLGLTSSALGSNGRKKEDTLGTVAVIRRLSIVVSAPLRQIGSIIN